MAYKTSKLILVVEDEPDLQRLIKLFLERSGYAVTTADNGLVALQKLNHALPDLVITDIMMPEMNGIELIKEMKKKDEWANIPVVVTSAMIAEPEITKLSDEFLNKPVAISTLRRTLSSMLS